MYQELVHRLAAEERLSVSECENLYYSHDLDALCAAANEVRHARANGTAYLGLRREITYTTICGNACPVILTGYFSQIRSWDPQEPARFQAAARCRLMP